MGSSFPSWSSVFGTTGTGSSNSRSSVVGTISRAASSSDADSVFFSASVSNSCEAAGNASNVITHLYWTVLPSPPKSFAMELIAFKQSPWSIGEMLQNQAGIWSTALGPYPNIWAQG